MRDSAVATNVVCDVLPWSSGMESTLISWPFLPGLPQVTELQEMIGDSLTVSDGMEVIYCRSDSDANESVKFTDGSDYG